MIQFTVIDMTCSACANRISRALQQASLPPEVQVDIDVAARQVRFPQGASVQVVQLIREAIEAAGYTPVASDLTPVNSAVPRAGGCCCAAKRTPKLDVDQRATAQRQRCFS